MIAIAELTSIEQLSSMRLLWRALLGKTRGATFFQSAEWLEAWWRYSGEGQSLKVLCIGVGGKTIGMVPLTVRRETTDVGRLRTLNYPLDDWGTFYGPVGANPTAALYAAMRHLQQSPRDWDLIDLRHVDEARLDQGRTANALRMSGLSALEQTWAELPAIRLDQWDAGEVFARHSQLRRAEHQLSNRGRLISIRHRPAGNDLGPAEMRRDLLDDCLKLLRDRPENERQLIADAYHAAALAAMVELNLVYLNGRPAACAINFVNQGEVDVFAAAVDPELAPAATDVLRGRMLLDAMDLGDTVFRFSPRTAWLAEGWSNATLTSGRHTHFASVGLRAQLLRLNQWGRRLLSRKPVTVSDLPA